MINQRSRSIARGAASSLILSFVTNLAGVVMFSIRDGAHGGLPPSRTFFVWERCFFVAAVVLNAIGFVWLERDIERGPGRVMARIGSRAYLFAGMLVVAAEALILSTAFTEQQVLALIVIYVVVAFLAQAAIGWAVLQRGVVPPWIGWTTILWNLGCLIVLPVITPHDVYFPVLHHLAPLLIGGGLLWRST